MMSSSNQVFNKFKDEIIAQCGDTKSGSWQKLSQQLEEFVGKEGFNFDLLSPKMCVLNSVQRGTAKRFGGLAKHIDSIENAFYCLSLFALNLCRQPEKNDFRLIKTYTSFYTCNIASVMLGDDMPILLSMGYKISAIENEDELTLDHVNRDIETIAYQLFLAQLYCRRVKTIVITITTNGFSDEIATELFEHFDKPEFDMKLILEFCESKKRQMMTNQYKLKEQNNTPPLSYNSVNKVRNEKVHGNQFTKSDPGTYQSPGNQFTKSDPGTYQSPYNGLHGNASQPFNHPSNMHPTVDKTFQKQAHLDSNSTVNKNFHEQTHMDSKTQFDPYYSNSDNILYENSRSFNVSAPVVAAPVSLLTEVVDDDDDLYGGDLTNEHTSNIGYMPSSGNYQTGAGRHEESNSHVHPVDTRARSGYYPSGDTKLHTGYDYTPNYSGNSVKIAFPPSYTSGSEQTTRFPSIYQQPPENPEQRLNMPPGYSTKR